MHFFTDEYETGFVWWWMVKSRALIFDNVIVGLREHISATHLMKFVEEEFAFLHSSSNKQKIPSVLWSNTSGNEITSQIDKSALKLYEYV